MAGGRRRSQVLGSSADGFTRQAADEELAYILARVRRGEWRPPAPARRIEPPDPEPDFHTFASEWMELKRPELRESSAADYEWAICNWLLPAFADFPLSAIDVEAVDRFKAGALRAGLGARQVNKCLTRLGAILEAGVERGHLARNPVRVGRRRLKAPPPQRSWVEPEQLPALLAAADDWHRPVLATMVGAGLRVGEACRLDWRDVSLAVGTITVQQSKTAAGAGRVVDVPGGLLDELAELKARSARTGPTDPVLVCRPWGGRVSRQTKDNAGRRLKGTIRRANEALAKAGIEPISERVSPHSLRRSYASLRFALGDDPVYVSEQLGHAEPSFSMRVYAKAIRRRERLPASHREAFDRALEWARIGTNADSEPLEPAKPEPSGEPERPLTAG
jgi:integrase